MSNIDPSTVKAGDTVTLERNRSTVTGPAHIGMPGAISLHLPGSSIWINNSDRADDPVSGGWTLTGHQPAPEPEPEWKPGTVAEGTVNGTIVRGLIGRDDNGTGDVFTYWNEFARHMSITGHVPDDVRPLVVIDPAAVDVDALVEVAHHDRVLYGDTTPDQMRRAILRILAHMGIEAP